MDQVYLKHAARYRSIVDASEPTLKLRILTSNRSPNIAINVKIRPLATGEEHPCAIHPQAGQRNLLDVQDLYNHPSGNPRLRSYNYQLDEIFDVRTTTEKIYEDLVADLVPFARDGGIVTLFCLWPDRL